MGEIDFTLLPQLYPFVVESFKTVSALHLVECIIVHHIKTDGEIGLIIFQRQFLELRQIAIGQHPAVGFHLLAGLIQLREGKSANLGRHSAYLVRIEKEEATIGAEVKRTTRITIASTIIKVAFGNIGIVARQIEEGLAGWTEREDALGTRQP